MKKLLALILVSMLAFGMFGCKNKSNTTYLNSSDTTGETTSEETTLIQSTSISTEESSETETATATDSSSETSTVSTSETTETTEESTTETETESTSLPEENGKLKVDEVRSIDLSDGTKIAIAILKDSNGVPYGIANCQFTGENEELELAYIITVGKVFVDANLDTYWIMVGSNNQQGLVKVEGGQVVEKTLPQYSIPFENVDVAEFSTQMLEFLQRVGINELL